MCFLELSKQFCLKIKSIKNQKKSEKNHAVGPQRNPYKSGINVQGMPGVLEDMIAQCCSNYHIEICFDGMIICFNDMKICYDDMKICFDDIELCFDDIEICYDDIEMYCQNTAHIPGRQALMHAT